MEAGCILQRCQRCMQCRQALVLAAVLLRRLLQLAAQCRCRGGSPSRSGVAACRGACAALGSGRIFCCSPNSNLCNLRTAPLAQLGLAGRPSCAGAAAPAAAAGAAAGRVPVMARVGWGLEHLTSVIRKANRSSLSRRMRMGQSRCCRGVPSGPSSGAVGRRWALPVRRAVASSAAELRMPCPHLHRHSLAQMAALESDAAGVSAQWQSALQGCYTNCPAPSSAIIRLRCSTNAPRAARRRQRCTFKRGEGV